MIWALIACSRLTQPTGASPPEGFTCPGGTTWHHEVVADVEVHTCRAADVLDGPQLERYVGGGVAVEGQWVGGERDGVWTSWFPDGAFRSQVTWRGGVQHGPRREVSSDGRVVEVTMRDGVAVDLRGLPSDALMPEWHAGQRIEGVLYRGHSATPSGVRPSPSP